MRRTRLGAILPSVALLLVLTLLFGSALAQDEAGTGEPAEQDSQQLSAPGEQAETQPDLGSSGQDTALDTVSDESITEPTLVEQTATAPPAAPVPGTASDVSRAQPQNADIPPIRVRAGGEPYTDSSGRIWAADSGFSGGSTASTTARIAGTYDVPLYQTLRYGNFHYQFPVPNGVYTVTLRFAEWYWDNPGQRVFDVNLQGQPFLPEFDILAQVPKFTALDEWAVVQVIDGMLTIEFINRVDNANVSAIEIVPGENPPAAPAPIAGVSGEVASDARTSGPGPGAGGTTGTPSLILGTGGGTMSGNGGGTSGGPSNPEDASRAQTPAQSPSQPPQPAAQSSAQGPSQPPAQGAAPTAGDSTADPASTSGSGSGCGDPASMAVTAAPTGVRFQARGFAPGTLVQAWVIGPVRDGEAVNQPDRGADGTYTVDDTCRVGETMSLIPNTLGRYGVYLAGERFGGGPPVRMFQLIQLSPSSVSTGLGGTGAMTTESAPEAPGSAVARAVDRATIRLEWADNSRNEQGFRIEITSGGTGVFAVPSNATTYAVGGLRPDTDYCFSIKAFNGAGTSSGADVCGRTAK